MEYLTHTLRTFEQSMAQDEITGQKLLLYHKLLSASCVGLAQSNVDWSGH